MLSKQKLTSNGRATPAKALDPADTSPSSGLDQAAASWPPADPAAFSRIELAVLRFVRLPWRTVLTGAALFAIFTAFLAAVQFSTPNLAGNDGYYHIKMAQILRTEGLKPAFPWLPQTILQEEAFVDHHYLYHILLIPFTFGDLRLGAKLASMLFPAATFLAAWVLLHRQKVPYAPLWSLGLLVVSEAFLYRMSMPRAQSLSLLVLLLGLTLLLERRFLLLAPLAFLYVWLYNAFPLLLGMAGIYTGVVWLLEKRLEWRPLASVAAGLALGLVINPYFPENLIFQFHHIGGKVFDPTASRVGNEWYPYRTTTLLENSGPTFLVFAAGILALGFHKQRMNIQTATSLILALLFGAMVFESRRFIEYFPPFALLFCALAAAPLLDQGQADTLSRWRRWAVPVLLVALLIPSGLQTLRGTQDDLQSARPYQRYALASTWLMANTAPGEPVFQTDWDDFPQLFFYNTHNTYTVGLDPTYMEIYDPALFERWVDITQGKVENPSQDIRTTFNANHVITDLKHDKFLDAARADPQMVEVFADEFAVIFQIRP